MADIMQAAGLLHGEVKTQAHAAGHVGVEKRAETAALERKIDWQIARKTRPDQGAGESQKANVRPFVEHPSTS